METEAKLCLPRLRLIPCQSSLLKSMLKHPNEKLHFLQKLQLGAETYMAINAEEAL